MRAAAAEIVLQCFLDLGFGRPRVLAEEGGGFHDHAVDAVAALGRLLLDEGALHRVRLFGRAQAFERHDLLLGGERGQRHDSGAHRLAVDLHGAGAALRHAAAEARAAQGEVVAQRVEQRHVGIVDGERFPLAVDVECLRNSHCISPDDERIGVTADPPHFIERSDARRPRTAPPPIQRARPGEDLARRADS